MRHMAPPERDYFGMQREDYLQVIHHLEASTEGARVSDIALLLKVKKPAVSQMVKRLATEGYLASHRYGEVRLTAKGRRTASRVLERRKALTELFEALGIPKKVQEHDIHGIEHYLSPITLKKIQALAAKLRKK